MASLQPSRTVIAQIIRSQKRCYSGQLAAKPPVKRIPKEYKPPRHLLSISDLTPRELTELIINAKAHKKSIKRNYKPLKGTHSSLLQHKTVAMMFNKRSTRTRVSTEAAVTLLGGHPMFLGKDDIQLGVNESVYDTSVVISSMTSCIVARVGDHSEVVELAKHSTVPVINALSNDYHPLQTIADFLTIVEAFPLPSQSTQPTSSSVEVNNTDSTPNFEATLIPQLQGKKIAWIGDSNNVLFDLAIGAIKLGVKVSVASPEGYKIPSAMKNVILSAAEGVKNPGSLVETSTPEEAIKDADILVTDTWISMGQEGESAERLKAFEGYKITHELAERGGAKPGWKFMHCLPRHQEEVSDEVFYSEERSLVFQEAENRLWAALAVLESFVRHKGNIHPSGLVRSTAVKHLALGEKPSRP